MPYYIIIGEIPKLTRKTEKSFVVNCQQFFFFTFLFKSNPIFSEFTSMRTIVIVFMTVNK